MEKSIQIKNLIKKYPQADKNAVDDISFDIYAGELFAFLGVNGAGKSTTINVICTLLEKTSGNIVVGDYILGRDNEGIRRQIGIVFQNSVMDGDLTARENLEIRGAFYHKDKAVIRERIAALSNKLSMSEFLDRHYKRLSGGQRRKVDIARALIAQPKILILDEPTTGLDPQSRIDLWKIVEEIRREENMTVLLTTHYMEETDVADRVAIIDKGRLLCIDTPQKLKSKYSTDEIRMIALPGKEAEVIAMLDGCGFRYEKKVDTYCIMLDRATEFLSHMPKFDGIIESFEVEKGNMDKVFLNVVGRSFNNV